MKNFVFVEVWTSFDLQLNLWLTMGVLVILAEMGTSGVLMPEQVVSHHSRCSHGPIERENNFFGFSGVQHANQGWTK